MSRFLNGRLQSLAPYVPGEQPKGGDWIKLNTNESPFPPSPEAVRIANSAEAELLRLYSDPAAGELTEAIAGFYGLDRRQVVVSNGSDEILAFLFAGMCEGGAVFPDTTYGFYRVFAERYGIPYREIALKSDFSLDVSDYEDCSETVFIANPNAQTGIGLPLSEVERLVCQNPDRLVVVDEAYVDFGGTSAAALLAKYDNLAVVQTFSKSRGLAGARIGFCLTSPAIADDLQRIRNSFNPYNVNRLSQKMAAAAMRDRAYWEQTRSEIIRNREELTAGLRRLGCAVLPSSANFVLARRQGLGGRRWYLALYERGILVRHFPGTKIEDYVRITIGTRSQMQALLQQTEQIIKEARNAESGN